MPGEPWTPPELPSSPGEKRPDGSAPPQLPAPAPARRARVPDTVRLMEALGVLPTLPPRAPTQVTGSPVVLNELESFKVSAPMPLVRCSACGVDLRGSTSCVVLDRSKAKLSSDGLSLETPGTLYCLSCAPKVTP